MAELHECPTGSVNVQVKLYLYSFYWALATVTTIGYGDVTPQTSKETYFAIVVMLLGGFFWAWILGSACVILGALTESETTFKQSVDKMNTLISRCNISPSLAFDLRAYLYNTSEVRESRDYQEVLFLVSPELQGKVIFEWFGEWILQVSYIADGSPPFVVEVARSLSIQVYAPRESITNRRTLYALDRGVAWRKMLPMVKGAVWGQDMILSSSELRDEVPVYCMTFVEARFLPFNSFASVIDNHAADKARMRRFVVKYALKRGILVYAKRVKDAERQLNVHLTEMSVSLKPSSELIPGKEIDVVTQVWITDDVNGDGNKGGKDDMPAPAALPSGEELLDSPLPGQIDN